MFEKFLENSSNWFILGCSDIESCKIVVNEVCRLWLNNEVDIFWFNEVTGYAYAYLENGISICSCFWNDVEFLVTNFDNWEEFFLDKFDEACELVYNF